MQKQKLPSFSDAVETGEVTHKNGYHQPHKVGVHQRGCGCNLTTDKGAYRDVTVEMPDGRTVHYYHQTPVVVKEKNGIYRVNSGGYRTRTTKDRIRGHLPAGWNVIQRDSDWYVTTPDGDRIEFEDGLEIEA